MPFCDPTVVIAPMARGLGSAEPLIAALVTRSTVKAAIGQFRTLALQQRMAADLCVWSTHDDRTCNNSPD